MPLSNSKQIVLYLLLGIGITLIKAQGIIKVLLLHVLPKFSVLYVIKASLI